MREPILPYIREAVIRRDHKQCRYCGIFPPRHEIEIDHVIPVADGGRSLLNNLVTSCRTCNRQKSAKTWIPNEIEFWHGNKQITKRPKRRKRTKKPNPLYDPRLSAEAARDAHQKWKEEKKKFFQDNKSKRV